MARGVIGQMLEQGRGRGLSQLPDRLAHRGQRRIDIAAQFDVVETDDGQLPRHRDAQLGGRAQCADAHQVVAGEDGGGPLAGGQQLARGAVAAGAREVAFGHARGLLGHASLAQGPVEAGQPAGGHAQRGRAADAGNAAVSELHQMPGRQVGAFFVVDLHLVGQDAFGGAVHHHHGQRGFAQRIDQRSVRPGAADDEAVDAFFHQHAQVVALLAGVVIGVAQDDAVARRGTDIFDAARQFGEVGVGGGRHQHADGARGAVLERTRHGAGHVARGADGFFHALARLRVHRPCVVDDMRDGGERHPG